MLEGDGGRVIPMAAIIKELLDAGLQGDKLVAAIGRIELAAKSGLRTARQDRNSRYYQKRLNASEKRLNASYSDDETVERLNSDDKRLKTSETSYTEAAIDPSPAPPHPPLNPHPVTLASLGTPAAASYPVDPTERLWAEGMDAMRAMGAPERSMRSMIGKWLSEQKNPATVLGAILEARIQGTKDPVALVSRILKPVQRNGGTHVSASRSVAAAADRLVDYYAAGGRSPFDIRPGDDASETIPELLPPRPS